MEKLNDLAASAVRVKDVKDGTVFLNPFMDTSFKKLFGEEDSKVFLIGLLNDIFEGERVIVDLVYINSELHPEVKDGKKNSVDILCTDIDENRYIVEMQYKGDPFFTERMFYYLARVVSNSSLRSGEDYSDIRGVYTVVLMNFSLHQFKKQKKLEFTMCAREDPDIVLTNKYKEIFVQLPLFESKKFENCCTNLEKWIYLLKNMEKFKSIPEYIENEKALFKEFLEKAKKENLSAEEKAAYDKQMINYKSYISSFDYAHDEGFTEGMEAGLADGRAAGLVDGRAAGLAEGREAGLADGRAAGLAEGREAGLADGRAAGLAEGREAGLADGMKQQTLTIAKTMKSNGLSFEVISQSTGLPFSEIEKI